MGSLFEFNLFFLSITLIFSVCIYYGSNVFNFQNLIKNFGNVYLIRLILMVSLVVSFFVHCYIVWIYLFNFSHKINLLLYQHTYTKIKWNVLYDINVLVLGGFNFSFELFGLIFIMLAYLVGVISFLSLDTRLYWKNIRFIFICNFLVLIVVLFASINDILFFFLLYEALLLPSFLFVYFISPSRRSTQASIYFLIWTQVGSFLVLCSVSYIIYVTGTTSFTVLKNFIFTPTEIFWLYFLFFFGFGFKIPVWPFHYWLTKTHVEAPTGFSIFLSGFLVKSAVYGFYRLTNLLGGDLETTVLSTFCVLGILDSSLKMWGQTDLKKLVAYGTIQEMGLIYLAFCWGDGVAILGGIFFCITHAFLSSLLFYLVDCIQRRYNTRSVVEVSGILHTTPNLGISIIVAVIFYAGLPGTLKFTSEFYIFIGLFETAPLTGLILLYIVNFLGLIGFSKCWFNVVFGITVKNQDLTPVDLTAREFLVIFFCVFFMVFFNFVVNIYF